MRFDHATLVFWSKEEAIEVDYRAIFSNQRFKGYFSYSQISVSSFRKFQMHGLDLGEITETSRVHPFHNEVWISWTPIGECNLSYEGLLEVVSTIALQYPVFTYDWQDEGKFKKFTKEHPEDKINKSDCSVFSYALADHIKKDTTLSRMTTPRERMDVFVRM